MRTSAYLLTVCFVVSIFPSIPTLAQAEIANPQAIASAKSVYFENKSGVDAVGKKASAELTKWGRFQIEPNSQKADLIVVLSTDPNQGGDLILSGGQTATIDSQGHIEEDRVPNYNKLGPVRYAVLTVMDARSGESLCAYSKRWGGLLTGFDSVGERLVKEFEKQTQLADQRSRLKLVKSVNPTYPPEASIKHIEGAVVVSVVVDKSGRVTRAQALSGPPELFQASVNAAKQFRFEPPEHAPVTTDVQTKYRHLAPCPPGKTGNHGVVEYSARHPMKTGHPGELKILEDKYLPLPPYLEEAMEAGTEGDLDLFITVAHTGDVIGARVINSLDTALDEAALTTVRTWKFKVSSGEPGGFLIKLRYRIQCSSLDQ